MRTVFCVLIPWDHPKKVVKDKVCRGRQFPSTRNWWRCWCWWIHCQQKYHSFVMEQYNNNHHHDNWSDSDCGGDNSVARSQEICCDCSGEYLLFIELIYLPPALTSSQVLEIFVCCSRTRSSYPGWYHHTLDKQQYQQSIKHKALLRYSNLCKCFRHFFICLLMLPTSKHGFILTAV